MFLWRPAHDWRVSGRGDGLTLSTIQRVFYRALISKALLEKEGTPFEEWFNELARRAWGRDFEPVRAQGRHGDLKCDGHRKSTGTIFQCYAPRRLNNAALTKKISEDFHGARTVWQERMKVWSLVLNDRAGLCAGAKEQTDALQASNQDVSVETFGPIELESLALGLPLEHLGDLCGLTLDAEESRAFKLSFDAIAKVVGEISGANPVPSIQPLSLPAANKAEHNCLDKEIRDFLARGEQWGRRVGQYFSETVRVEEGERLSAQLKNAYSTLREAGKDPNEIFFEFLDLCGGIARPAGERVAVYALLSYFFNACDIFENAPGHAS